MGKRFDFLNKKLSSLYVKAETLIEQDGNPELLNELLCEINDTYSLLEKAILNHEESSKGEFLSSNLSRLHSEKARFDKNTAEWLAKVTRRDTDAPAATSVKVSTFCSDRSNGSSSTSRSTLLLARTNAKREVAHLRIRHLQEGRDLQEKELDIQQQREDNERKLKQQRERETLRFEHQREALKVLHFLQEAEIERQVFEEELERGCYIPPEDLPPETSKAAA